MKTQEREKCIESQLIFCGCISRQASKQQKLFVISRAILKEEEELMSVV